MGAAPPDARAAEASTNPHHCLRIPSRQVAALPVTFRITLSGYVWGQLCRSRERGVVDFESVVGVVGTVIESVGVAIIAFGSLGPLLMQLVRLARGRREAGGWAVVRRDVGRALLLGLEFLVAGDIIRTVVGTISFESLGLLAGVVVIRTFLSFTITAEIEGRWPWRSGT